MLVKFSLITCLNCLRARGEGGCTGLSVLQPIPCITRSCMGREGHGGQVYQYTRSIMVSCPIVLLLFSGFSTFNSSSPVSKNKSIISDLEKFCHACKYCSSLVYPYTTCYSSI